MELRMWSLCKVFITLAVVQCCVNAHVLQKRDDASDIQPENEKLGDIETVGMEYVVKLGDRVQMECKVVSEGPELPIVQWDKVGGKEKGDIALYLNSLKIMSSENPLYRRSQYISDGGRHDLVINGVQASDVGEYKCELVQSKQSSVRHTLKIAAESKN